MGMHLLLLSQLLAIALVYIYDNIIGKCDIDSHTLVRFETSNLSSLFISAASLFVAWSTFELLITIEVDTGLIPSVWVFSDSYRGIMLSCFRASSNY